MQNFTKKTITRNSDEGVATVATEDTKDTQSQTIASIIYFFSGLLEVALGFRFILKMTGANAATSFVSGVYTFTQVLVAPFRGIFPTAASTGTEIRAVFEPATLVAMAVYAIAAWGVVKMIAIAAGRSSEEL